MPLKLRALNVFRRGGMPIRHSSWKPVGVTKSHADTQLDQFVRGPSQAEGRGTHHSRMDTLKSCRIDNVMSSASSFAASM
jgi:hypothetical protein